ERQLSLEVAPACGEHAEPCALRGFTSRGEQPALPDPGRPFHQREAAPALERILNQVLENTELAVALEQHDRRRRHGSRFAVDRHRRVRYRGSRSEISARISSTTSGGTSSMPCCSRACTITCWRISSSDSP